MYVFFYTTAVIFFERNDCNFVCYRQNIFEHFLKHNVDYIFSVFESSLANYFFYKIRGVHDNVAIESVQWQKSYECRLA